MKRISYTAIRTTLTQAMAAVRAAQPRVRTRTLDAADIDVAIALLRRARRTEAQADSWAVVLRGGYVPNSYRFAGEADELRLVVTADGDVTATFTRTRAQSRRHGVGATAVVRAVYPGQTQGRVVYSG